VALCMRQAAEMPYDGPHASVCAYRANDETVLLSGQS
jgi:hypothetical protein